MGVFKRNSNSRRGGRPQASQRQRSIRASAPQNPASNAIVPQIVYGVSSAAPVPYNAPRPLTASAAQIKIGNRDESMLFKERRASSSSMWQSEAWEYYDAIGEIKYAFNLVASVVSRIKLYPAIVTNPADTPTALRDVDSEDDARLLQAAERAIKRLDSAYGGQSGLLRDAALNLQVTGECYLTKMPATLGTGHPETWDIRSVDEIVADGKGNYIVIVRREMKTTTSGGTMKKGNVVLPKNAFVGRIWKSHPRFTDEADSSMRGILDLCAELLLLNRTFRATARSRLNAGALYLPDGLSVAATPDIDYPYDESDGLYEAPTPEEFEDEFEDQLVDAMTTPIKDEDSASAVVPLIIRGPAELGDKIKQFKFERSFDPALAERSDRVLERIMQGLDVPKDIVTGLANVKYSNALQIDESLYKAHIEPLMLLISDALTAVYLRPYLSASGFTEEEVDRVVVWYDPSQVATRNDRAADADAGFDKMAVSYDTWRHAHGFSEVDAPTSTELALRMLIQKGAFTPELTEAMLGAVAPDVMEAVRSASQASNPAPVPPEVEQMLAGQSAAPAAPAEEPMVPLAEPTAEAPAAEEPAPEPAVPLAEPTPEG